MLEAKPAGSRKEGVTDVAQVGVAGRVESAQDFGTKRQEEASLEASQLSLVMRAGALRQGRGWRDRGGRVDP